MSDISEASEPDADVPLKDVMRKLLTIEKRQKHTKLQLRAEFRADMDVRIGPLEQSYTELVAGQNILRDRVDAIENSFGGETSEDFKRLFRATEAADASHTRIELKGFEAKDSAQDRIKKIEAALKKKLGRIEFQIAHIP